MADDPATAAIRRKARETIERLERAANSPEERAKTAARQEQIRKADADARIDAALANDRARAARGELTPEQSARRAHLNNKWQTRYDGRGHSMSDAEFREMQSLDEIHARKPKQAPAQSAPRPAVPASRKGKKEMDELTKAVTDAVAKEISEHRRERELQAAKIETALAKLDAALARAEVGGAGKDRENRMLMVTR